MKKLSNPQYEMLLFYHEHGLTSQSFGSMNTLVSLVRQGYLARSRGLGVTQTEITEAGLDLLKRINGE